MEAADAPRNDHRPAAVSLLITGARGQLGVDLLAAAAEAGIRATGYGSDEVDITDADRVNSVVGEAATAASGAGNRLVVINSAAYTAVDAAQTDSARAYAVNETGPANLARSAAAAGAGLIHVSTDYVFPGDADRAYQVEDPIGPRSVYGSSKLAGERAVLQAHPAAHVVRTAWVYGAGGKNFVKTMARLQASHPEITVVDDQRGTPTWTVDLAAGLIALAEATAVPGGVLHATGGGETTWCGFAKAIFTELGADPARVRPITSAEYPAPAPRPAYSVLSPDAWTGAGLPPLRDWREALSEAFRISGDSFRPA